MVTESGWPNPIRANKPLEFEHPHVRFIICTPNKWCHSHRHCLSAHRFWIRIITITWPAQAVVPLIRLQVSWLLPEGKKPLHLCKDFVIVFVRLVWGRFDGLNALSFFCLLQKIELSFCTLHAQRGPCFRTNVAHSSSQLLALNASLTFCGNRPLSSLGDCRMSALSLI